MTTHTLVPSEDVDDHEAEEEEGEGVSNPIHTGKIHRSDKGHNYDRIESDSEAWSSHTTTAVAATVEAPFSSSSSLVHKVRHDATISKGGHSQYNSSDDQDLLKGMYTLSASYYAVPYTAYLCTSYANVYHILANLYSNYYKCYRRLHPPQAPDSSPQPPATLYIHQS